MWIHPINSESLGRNKLKTRNQIGIPCVSVIIGIGMYRLPARSVSSRWTSACEGNHIGVEQNIRELQSLRDAISISLAETRLTSLREN